VGVFEGGEFGFEGGGEGEGGEGYVGLFILLAGCCVPCVSWFVGSGDGNVWEMEMANLRPCRLARVWGRGLGRRGFRIRCSSS